MDSNLISPAEFDAAEARYLTLKAAVSSAEAGVSAQEAAVEASRVAYENTFIRAPFNGTVLTKNAEVGEVVAPFGSSNLAKAAVVTIADMASLQVEADVSETYLEKVQVGQNCRITLDAYPEEEFKGVVETIVPTLDRAKATVLTKIRLLDRSERILPEMSAKIAFLSDPPQGREGETLTAVPPAAVAYRSGQSVVYRLNGDRVEEIAVRLGGPVSGLTKIEDGPTAGEQVVLNPSEGLSDGDRVRVLVSGQRS